MRMNTRCCDRRIYSKFESNRSRGEGLTRTAKRGCRVDALPGNSPSLHASCPRFARDRSPTGNPRASETDGDEVAEDEVAEGTEPTATVYGKGHPADLAAACNNSHSPTIGALVVEQAAPNGPAGTE